MSNPNSVGNFSFTENAVSFEASFSEKTIAPSIIFRYKGHKSCIPFMAQCFRMFPELNEFTVQKTLLVTNEVIRKVVQPPASVHSSSSVHCR